MGSTVTVTTGEGEGAFVNRNPGGDQIRVGVTNCGAATVLNTDTIVWDDQGSGGGETFFLNLANGPFAPGLTNEPDLTDEIEFDLSSDIQVESGDFTSIQGTTGVDVIVAGDGPVPGFNFSLNSVNLNNDLDADVSLFSQSLNIQTLEGNDFLEANGGLGTGGAFDPRVVLQGGIGNDLLIDGDGGDTVIAHDGNDRWVLGLGEDFGFGELGFDTIDAGALTHGVSANMDSGTIGGNTVEDNFTGFEAFDGSPFDDTITGGGAAATAGAVIKGKQGDDTITGTNLADLLLGGQGDDVVKGLGDPDTLRGNDGEDTLRAAAGIDLVAGGGADDVLRGGADDDTLRGQGGNDNLAGGDGDDVLNGGTGMDTCSGGAGNNAIRACEL